MRLHAINVYPVKSLGGSSAAAADVEPWGLRHDRRWLAVDADGAVITGREQRGMLRVTAAPQDDGSITLCGADGSVLHVETPVAGEFMPTHLSRVGFVRRAPAEASAWLSEQIGMWVNLAWLDDPRRRSVSEKHGGEVGDMLSLADAGPLLLTTTASLRQLNEWVADAALDRGETPEPIAMERFRPNVVIDGLDQAFAEDEWKEVSIGSVRFRFAERCDRCMFTMIDPGTLAMSKEPLRTLAKHRRSAHKTFFGIRLIPTKLGTIHSGDGVSAF